MTRTLLTALLGLFVLNTNAQQTPYPKFGKITVADLQRKAYAIDSSASAVVLNDVGETSIDGNNKGWFAAITTRHKIVHILTKPGYRYAEMEIQLYAKDGSEEKLEDVKAVTYNLEGDKIVQTKLERANIFKEKKTDEIRLMKFTMPAVKEGSIIEIQYKVSSDYFHHIDPWVFQLDIPTLWSEYNFSVPQFFTYGFLSRGYIPFLVNDKKDSQGLFNISDATNAGPTQRTSFTSGVTNYRWVQKDIPAIKEENFISSLQNYISKIEFQLTSQTLPLNPKDFRNTWPMITKSLLESEYFGSNLNSNNGWLADDMNVILSNATSDLEKGIRIYNYVRDNFACNNHRAVYTEGSIKNVFKARKGNVAEVNLLLTAMLRYAKLQADPVLLSRTPYGYSFELYPSIPRLNYVITQLRINDKPYYLDASQTHLGFGHLMAECYNGHARVVNEQATSVYFPADSLKERKVTALFLNKDAKTLWKGSMTQSPGYMESIALRQKIKEKGKEEFFKEIEKAYTTEVSITNATIDSLTKYEYPIGLKYEISFNQDKEDIIYINPMFGEGYKKNPFVSAQRAYPVEMPYASDETFVLNLQVPDGYEVEELPKQMLAKFDEEGKTFFEYRLQQNDDFISLRSRIKIDRAYYSPEEYEILREFFGMIVKKHSEQIVLKKKK